MTWKEWILDVKKSVLRFLRKTGVQDRICILVLFLFFLLLVPFPGLMTSLKLHFSPATLKQVVFLAIGVCAVGATLFWLSFSPLLRYGHFWVRAMTVLVFCVGFSLIGILIVVDTFKEPFLWIEPTPEPNVVVSPLQNFQTPLRDWASGEYIGEVRCSDVSADTNRYGEKLAGVAGQNMFSGNTISCYAVPFRSSMVYNSELYNGEPTPVETQRIYDFVNFIVHDHFQGIKFIINGADWNWAEGKTDGYVSSSHVVKTYFLSVPEANYRLRTFYAYIASVFAVVLFSVPTSLHYLRRLYGF
jgi:hypothetical protein